MVEIKRDRKAKNIWIITKTDNEGFHHQLSLTNDEMHELVAAMSNAR